MIKISPSRGGGAGSISGQGAKIPHALWPENQNIKQKQYRNKFNKDLKNSPRQKKIFSKIYYLLLLMCVLGDEDHMEQGLPTFGSS